MNLRYTLVTILSPIVCSTLIQNRGAKPKIIISQEHPLSVNTYGLPEAIDKEDT